MLVVGIAGGTGSGKTTVVNRILDRLPDDKVTILPQDAYYKDNSQMNMEDRQEVNFDHPDMPEAREFIDKCFRFETLVCRASEDIVNYFEGNSKIIS